MFFFKIPATEWVYIRDQREKSGTKGAFQMGRNDIKESTKISKAMKRKAEEEASVQRKKEEEEEKAKELCERKKAFDAEMEEKERTSALVDNDASPSRETDNKIRAQLNPNPHNKLRFPNVAEQSIRYGIPLELAAASDSNTG